MSNAELVAVHWNALHAFDDAERRDPALELLKRSEADIIGISETLEHRAGNEAAETEARAKLIEEMGRLGYQGTLATVTSLSGERNPEWISIWIRSGVGEVVHEPEQLGLRSAVGVAVPHMNMLVQEFHGDDQKEEKRTASMRIYKTSSPLYAAKVLLTDLNGMEFPQDPKSRLPHYVGQTVGRVPMEDFYDTSKPLKRAFGKVVRVGRMATGTAVRELTEAGYHRADPEHQVTIGGGKTAYTIDHIFGNDAVEFSNFSVIPAEDTYGRHISDHKVLRTGIRRK